MKPFTPEGAKLGLEYVGKFEILYSTCKYVYNVKVKEKAQPVIGYDVRLI